jgi:SAM-dependent methyltransferase
MPADNSEQIAEWNGVLGQRWVAMRQEIDPFMVPFGDAALKVAAPQLGERVIDIGCGCGDTAIELARMVGATGAVLGIDVSQPMLAVARSRGALANGADLTFREGDASEVALPANTDLLFSRFGVMFFSQPSPAFSHMRKSLRAGGPGGRRSECARAICIRRRGKAARHPVRRRLQRDRRAALRRGDLSGRDAALRSRARCRSGRFPVWCARSASNTCPSFSMLSNAR